MEEIIDAIMFEIENSGVADKLSAGVVLTGGGALLRHLPQLVKFKTGYDVRVGYPNEHLASESIEEINQPQFATSVGLILKGYEALLKKEDKIETEQPEPEVEEEGEDKPKNKANIFTNLKEKLNGIFEENDSAFD